MAKKRTPAPHQLAMIGKRNEHNTLTGFKWKEKSLVRNAGFMGVWQCDCGKKRLDHAMTPTRCCRKCLPRFYPESIPGYRHGLTRTPTYRVWVRIKRQVLKHLRNNNPVPIKKAWCKRTGAESFLADMGEKPDNTRFKMINLKKGYVPKNCYWKPCA